MNNPPNADARSDLPAADVAEALDAPQVSGRDFLDPGVDFSGEAFSAEEKRALLQWYREVHDIGDLDLAPFARFSLEHDPVGFKRLRRHVMTFDEAVEGASLPLFIGPLLFVHTYTAMGHGKGALYEVVAVRQLGVRRDEVLETIRLATLFGGPRGLNPLGEMSLEYFETWTDDDDKPPLPWPEGWTRNLDLLRSGIDPDTDDLTEADLSALRNWYVRTYGEVPRHVDLLARLHPRALKTERLRLELAASGALPVQMIPLFRLHFAAIHSVRSLMRRAVQMAQAFGICRAHVVATLFWASVYGGEAVLEEAFEATGDLLEVMS
jgi:hypothetical protein